MKDKGIVAEFRKFITKGNVLDMAVGVMIGAAFNAIVNSLVNDIISPLIGLATGGIDFADLAITLVAATADKPAVTLNIGLFINAVINFLVIALTLFIIIRSFNKFNELRTRKEKEAAAAAPAPAPAKSADIILLEEIRDLLKK